MSDAVETTAAAFLGSKKLPKGMAGFGAGLVSGYMVDKLLAHAYVTYVPESDRPVLPIFAADDWAMLILAILFMLKAPAFAGGWLLGMLIGSQGIPY